MRELKNMLVCTGLMVLALASVVARAQTMNALDPALHPTDKDLSVGTPALHPTDKDLSVGTPALQNRVDRIAAQVLETDWRALGLGGRGAGRQAGVHPRLRQSAAGYGYGSRRRLQRRRCATRSGRSPSNSPPRPFCCWQKEGKLEARRCGGQVRSRPHARRRSDHPADSLAHLRLPGLLAGGLRDDHR
jgi:hypothetical protein